MTTLLDDMAGEIADAGGGTVSGMSEPVTLPPRSILGIESCAGKCGDPLCPAIVISCDCATVTHLVVEVQGTGTGEGAVTCDGCSSVLWFAVTAPSA